MASGAELCFLHTTLRVTSTSTPVATSMETDFQSISTLQSTRNRWSSKTIKIARALLEYDVPVRMLDHGEYDDVGDMTKQEFSRRRQDAKPWNNTQGLLAKIQNMPIGSIL